jgi:hypothetical protein
MPKGVTTKISSDHKKKKNTAHFFQSNNNLHNKVYDYISVGLKNNETCIVIATPSTIIKLNKKLRDNNFNLDKLIDSENYITLDAQELLENVMVNSQVDSERFMISLGSLMKIATGKERPIIAFAETISLLYEDKNFEGIKQMEAYWNGLLNKFSFTLYCAYPRET